MPPVRSLLQAKHLRDHKMNSLDSMSHFLSWAKNRGKLPRGVNIKHLSDEKIFVEWLYMTPEGAEFCKSVLEEHERAKKADEAVRLDLAGFGQGDAVKEPEDKTFDDSWLTFSRTGKIKEE